MTELTTFNPDWLSAPGETIADLLEEKGWSQTELATRTGFTRKHINELVAGKAALTPETALKLESSLGGSARFWLAREAQFREAAVRRAAVQSLDAEADWLRELPLAEMIKFKWVEKMAQKGAQVAACLAFFGVATVAAWREKYEKPLAAFRASKLVPRTFGAIAAWLRQGERQAAEIQCAKYDEERFRRNLRELRSLTCERDPMVFVPRLLKTCRETGVAVVFVPAPTGCPTSGATRWLSSDRAILQLSLRYKTNDHMWFTLFHEAGHIVLHGRKLFLEGAGVIDERCEAEADAFAKDTLIEPAAAQLLKTLPKSHQGVEMFARQIGVAPGIVVGRMQKEGLLPWNHLNGLKERYRLTIS
jgi:addiction module HigA family antidote